MRHDGRKNDEIRPITVERGFIQTADSSVLISFGQTRVICTATLERGVPRFLRDTGRGWVTAEYAMLPASTNERIRRDSQKGKLSGRSMEIQRLIGRSLRSVIDLQALGEQSIVIDCDVIQADGGTRTTSITGAMIVLRDLVHQMMANGTLTHNPIQSVIAAISLGIVDGEVMVDLDYQEDSSAQVDLNLVMTNDGRFIEIQGTAEQSPFTGQQMTQFLALGQPSIESIIAKVMPH